MKPAVFNYFRPTEIEEVLNLLSEYGDDSKVLAGGQSLIPTMNMRLSTPENIIDISRLDKLNYIEQIGDNICIGALTKQKDVENSVLIKEVCPLLSEAIKWVGHRQIRNRGTVGGSIAHGDPSAELPCVLSALRGEIVVLSGDGSEEVFLPEDFFLTYMLTSLQPDQIIKEVRFPVIPKKNGYAFEEVARRHGDFGLAEAAAVISMNEDDVFTEIKISVGGANPTPLVLDAVEEYLIGKKPTENLFKKVAELTEDSVDPEPDIHGSEQYRKELAGTLAVRALKTAINRIKGEITNAGI